jgi:hypothetical protein
MIVDMGVKGPFWGEAEVAEGRTVESVPAAVAEALRGSDAAAPLAPAEAAEARAALVPFEADAEKGAVVVPLDLDAFAALPAAGLARPLVFRALADAAAALRAVHAAGRAHGAIRPEMIRVSVAAGHAALLAPAHAVDGRALLAAVVKSGAADVAVTAFVAPEVLAGGPALPAADVYSLAACAYHALTGELPFGQVDLRRATFGAPEWASVAVYQSLLATPSTRPDLDALERALRALEAAFASPAGAAAHAAAFEGLAAGGPWKPDAARRNDVSAILVLVLVIGGIFVLTGAIWLVAITWDAMGEAGHFALLLLLSGGVLGAGEVCRARKLERTALALTTIGTQLLWTDAAYILTVYYDKGEAGSWTIASALITAATLAFAMHRKSALLGSAAALDFAVAAVCFGAWISSGEPLGPTLYAATVAVAYAVIAAGGDRVAGRAIGVPFAVGAIGSFGVSALLALVLLADGHDKLFATCWPYVVLVVLGLPSLARLKQPYGALAGIAAMMVLAGVPTIQALIESDDLFYLAGAVGVGAAAATAAFVTPPFNRDTGLQIGMTAVGTVSVVGAPGFLALVHIDGDKSTLHLAIALGVGALLVALSYVLSARAASKAAYRVLEASGLLLFFGLLTIDSLAKIDSWVYPGILLAGATVVLALGATTRRAALVAIAGSALVLNVWIQYFGKLKEYVPVSLLCVGFGIALLVGGVLFEKKMRPLLPTMKAWA